MDIFSVETILIMPMRNVVKLVELETELVLTDGDFGQTPNMKRNSALYRSGKCMTSGNAWNGNCMTLVLV